MIVSPEIVYKKPTHEPLQAKVSTELNFKIVQTPVFICAAQTSTFQKDKLSSVGWWWCCWSVVWLLGCFVALFLFCLNKWLRHCVKYFEPVNERVIAGDI